MKKKIGTVNFVFYDDGTVKTDRKFNNSANFGTLFKAHAYIVKTLTTDMKEGTKCPFNPVKRVKR